MSFRKKEQTDALCAGWNTNCFGIFPYATTLALEKLRFTRFAHVNPSEVKRPIPRA